MIVCVCRVIRDSEIRSIARAGGQRCADVFRAKCTTPQCGGCVGVIRDMLREHAPPAAAGAGD